MAQVEDQVLSLVKAWPEGRALKTSTIASRLGIARKVVNSIMFSAMRQDPEISFVKRTPHNRKDKRPVWVRGEVQKVYGDFFHI